MRYGLWTLCFLSLSAYAQAPASIVLTAVENSLDSQSSFTCHGKIHGYLRFAERQNGAHVLESQWIAPSGKIAADSRTPLEFHPASSTAYVWFAFPESGGFLGAPDPQVDQDRLTFNGPWRLKVRWDGQDLLNKEFSVSCP